MKITWNYLQQIASKPVRTAVGLMSGTSLDGIDAVVVRLEGFGRGLRVQTLSQFHHPYTSKERGGLLRLIRSGSLSELVLWDAYLGQRFAQAALKTIRSARLHLQDIDFAGSHGQTIWHAPDAKLYGQKAGGTLQIGQPDVIATQLGVPVVADFRTRDVALGGQGAPLVPYVDWLLLSDPEEPRATLNLGGMANLTLLPPSDSPTEIFAFDTGPGNALMDLAASWATGGEQTYDGDGSLAAQGLVQEEVLSQLLQHPYFDLTPPKSTGREMFGEDFFKQAIEAFQSAGAHPPDVLATLTEFTARTIADALHYFVLPQVPVKRLIASGGGVHNQTLMARLQNLLPEITLETSDRYGIHPDYKEAIAFAVLADCYLRGEPASFPATTGVSRPALLGKLCLP